jgi:hypothetical protein
MKKGAFRLRLFFPKKKLAERAIMNLPDNSSNRKSHTDRFIIAAVLIWALELFRRFKHQPSTVAEVLQLTDATKSQAYKTLGRLKEASKALNRRPGRPASKQTEKSGLECVLRLTRDFLMENPGCAQRRGRRHRYTDRYRLFVLGLKGPGGAGEKLTVEQLADAVGVPLGTLKDWMRMPTASVDHQAASDKTESQPQDQTSQRSTDQKTECQSPPTRPSEDPKDPESPIPLSVSISDPQLATIVNEWENWKGDFTGFCHHMNHHHRIAFGRTFIGNLLEALGLRQRKKRGRNDPPWSRDAFRKLFPGAQWCSDGKTVAIRLNGKWYRFNWEATVDVASNAVVGIDVRDSEDADALIESHRHGVATTGKPPMAETVDNRPSNLCPEVQRKLAPTVVLEATPGRGQAKAPLEGTFGLFAQTTPPLEVQGNTPHELARSIITLLLWLWAWTRNGRPRKKLSGQSPRDFYQNYTPTPEQIEEAKRWINQLKRRQEKMRQSQQRRADPHRRAILQEALADLSIPDPNHRLASDLAIYSMDAILRGIAIFKSKKEMGTIPADADPGRYLGGIIRKLNQRQELELTAKSLFELRLKHQDLALSPLQKQAENLRRQHPIQHQPRAFVQKALHSQPMLDFRFWSGLAAKTLLKLPASRAITEYHHLARWVAASYSVQLTRRDDLIGVLSDAAALAQITTAS